jgi:hydroxymethylpyrimidine pyrophosphatase-like HAD family hydrolase
VCCAPITIGVMGGLGAHQGERTTRWTGALRIPETLTVAPGFSFRDPRQPGQRALAPEPVTVPRLVATDLDGTLLRSDGTVSPRTRRVLADVEAAGIEVVFVTARPPRWLGLLEDLVGGHGRVICLGGAAVWDLGSGRALDVCGFTEDAVRALVADLRDAEPDIALAFERVDGPVFDPWFPKDEPGIPVEARAVPVERSLGASHDDAPRELVAKLLAIDPRATGSPHGRLAEAGSTAHDDFFARVRDVARDRAHLAYSGAVGLAELLPPGVTKDAALERWCERLGVAAQDVWAFGDMPNDVPMLSWAGRAVAVANAHPEVLACADVVVGKNDDDGVAAYLEAALGAA